LGRDAEVGARTNVLTDVLHLPEWNR
jgi:hypothetical protein